MKKLITLIGFLALFASGISAQILSLDDLVDIKRLALPDAQSYLAKRNFEYINLSKEQDHVSYDFGVNLGKGYFFSYIQRNSGKIEVIYSFRDKDLFERLRSISIKAGFQFYKTGIIEETGYMENSYVNGNRLLSFGAQSDKQTLETMYFITLKDLL